MPVNEKPEKERNGNDQIQTRKQSYQAKERAVQEFELTLKGMIIEYNFLQMSILTQRPHLRRILNYMPGKYLAHEVHLIDFDKILVLQPWLTADLYCSQGMELISCHRSLQIFRTTYYFSPESLNEMDSNWIRSRPDAR